MCYLQINTNVIVRGFQVQCACIVEEIEAGLAEPSDCGPAVVDGKLYVISILFLKDMLIIVIALT